MTPDILSREISSCQIVKLYIVAHSLVELQMNIQYAYIVDNLLGCHQETYWVAGVYLQRAMVYLCLTDYLVAPQSLESTECLPLR